ncbi:MAG: protein kinase [Planctomycetota bacterium]|nr:protein kinase [Planctomycetota bacterium]
MADDNTDRTEGVGLPAGAKIGKYEVCQRLGIGGQAIIYKCRDETLDRYVAVKQISTHLAADAEFLRRFRKEAQTLARLASEQPAIVTIHELIEDECGLFIVMEYVSGRSLETVLDEADGPIEPKAALQIIWRLAAGLHTVHSAGIVHRDIKPSNIIIGENLRVKIADFGVAASITGQTSMLLGTTKYMAPELFGGQKIDGRADIYSLGFIAYEMLAGREKFNETFSDVVRDKHSESLRWMKWHGNEKVQAPALHQVNPAIPVALSEIVAKMMSKDLAKRFESAESLGRAIKMKFTPRGRAAEPSRRGRRKKAGRRPEAEKPSQDDILPQDEGDELQVLAESQPTAPIPKSAFPLRTKLLLAGVILLSALGIVVTLVVRNYQRRQHVGQTASTAYEAAIDHYKNARYTEAIKGFIRLGERFGGTSQSARASVMVRLAAANQAVIQQDWQTAAAEENEARQQLKVVQAARSDLLEWTRRVDTEIDDFQRYRTNTWTFRDAMSKAERDLADGMFNEARDVLKLRGVVLSTEQDAEREAFYNKLDRAEFRSVYDGHLSRGDGLAAQGKFDQAQAAYRQGQAVLNSDLAVKLLAEQRNNLQKTLNQKVNLLTVRRNYDAAAAAAVTAGRAGDKAAELAALQRMDRLRPAAVTKEKIKTLHASIELDRGRQLRDQGRLAEAKQAFEKSLLHKPTPEARNELAELQRSSRHQELVAAGDVAFAAGDMDEAVSQYTSAAKIRMDDGLAAKIAECRYRIKLAKADAFRDAGQYVRAAAAYEQARQIKPAAAADIDARQAAMRQVQRYEKFLAAGDKLLARRQWSKAIDMFRKAKAVRDTEQVNQRIALTRYSENVALGRAAMNQNNFSGALAYFKLARGFKDTDEVKALIAEAERRLKESK